MSAVLDAITWPFTAPFHWIGRMFSNEEKTRANAANWIELADKVWHFRQDLLTAQEAGELRTRTAELRQQLKVKADAARLKLSIEALEGTLRRTGGALYPKTSLVENVEFFLVAAIVILGVRTYFVQPFKIPTNSMWPTYHGMTAENFSGSADAPGTVERIFRFVAFGAQRRDVEAPQSGELTAEFDEITGAMVPVVKKGRSWLILPTQVKEYTFYVNDAPATIRVPLDFNEFDRIVWDTFLGGEQGFAAKFRDARQARAVQRQRSGMLAANSEGRKLRLSLRPSIEAGDTILRFDILTGDQLFVDRMSYHFVLPKVGQGFVFRTGQIPGIGDDQYYIKRLVGVPGDTIAIEEPVLRRNGRPIEGAQAFDLNARRVAPYRGYFNARGEGGSRGGRQVLLPGEELKVPADSFLALGDNSGSSLDSRYWGFVPEKDVIGRPLFIYYPFTRRWGPAK